MADVFEDRLTRSYNALSKQFGDRIHVPPERRFLGFDAYRKAIDCLGSGDVALLTTRAYPRATHLDYAVEKGVNVFMEKSFAPDPGGRALGADHHLGPDAGFPVPVLPVRRRSGLRQPRAASRRRGRPLPGAGAGSVDRGLRRGGLLFDPERRLQFPASRRDLGRHLQQRLQHGCGPLDLSFSSLGRRQDAKLCRHCYPLMRESRRKLKKHLELITRRCKMT